MPQCKIGGCREQALPSGKRYCAEHKKRYLAKQQEFAIRSASWPRCCNCLQPYNPEKNDGPSCNSCKPIIAERITKARAVQRRIDLLNNAASVEDLKNWLMEYVL